jgi:hypothetical protein
VQEDQIKVEELTALKEEIADYKHLTLLFTGFASCKITKKKKIAEILILTNVCFCYIVLSVAMHCHYYSEFKKEITGGFHLVMVVVDHALSR